jgi:GINS complex subunit 3
MSYLDIDKVISEEERIPCFFQSDAKNLGHLDIGNTDEDLPENSKIELPLWLVTVLSKKNMVRMELPKVGDQTCCFCEI